MIPALADLQAREVVGNEPDAGLKIKEVDLGKGGPILQALGGGGIESRVIPGASGSHDEIVRLGVHRVAGRCPDLGQAEQSVRCQIGICAVQLETDPAEVVGFIGSLPIARHRDPAGPRLVALEAELRTGQHVAVVLRVHLDDGQVGLERGSAGLDVPQPEFKGGGNVAVEPDGIAGGGIAAERGRIQLVIIDDDVGPFIGKRQTDLIGSRIVGHGIVASGHLRADVILRGAVIIVDAEVRQIQGGKHVGIEIVNQRDDVGVRIKIRHCNVDQDPITDHLGGLAVLVIDLLAGLGEHRRLVFHLGGLAALVGSPSGGVAVGLGHGGVVVPVRRVGELGLEDDLNVFVALKHLVGDVRAGEGQALTAVAFRDVHAEVAFLGKDAGRVAREGVGEVGVEVGGCGTRNVAQSDGKLVGHCEAVSLDRQLIEHQAVVDHAVAVVVIERERAACVLAVGVHGLLEEGLAPAVEGRGDVVGVALKNDHVLVGPVVKLLHGSRGKPGGIAVRNDLIAVEGISVGPGNAHGEGRDVRLGVVRRNLVAAGVEVGDGEGKGRVGFVAVVVGCAVADDAQVAAQSRFDLGGDAVVQGAGQIGVRAQVHDGVADLVAEGVGLHLLDRQVDHKAPVGLNRAVRDADMLFADGLIHALMAAFHGDGALGGDGALIAQGHGVFHRFRRCGGHGAVPEIIGSGSGAGRENVVERAVLVGRDLRHDGAGGGRDLDGADDVVGQIVGDGPAGNVLALGVDDDGPVDQAGLPIEDAGFADVAVKRQRAVRLGAQGAAGSHGLVGQTAGALRGDREVGAVEDLVGCVRRKGLQTRDAEAAVVGIPVDLTGGHPGPVSGRADVPDLERIAVIGRGGDGRGRFDRQTVGDLDGTVRALFGMNGELIGRAGQGIADEIAGLGEAQVVFAILRNDDRDGIAVVIEGDLAVAAVGVGRKHTGEFHGAEDGIAVCKFIEEDDGDEAVGVDGVGADVVAAVSLHVAGGHVQRTQTGRHLVVDDLAVGGDLALGDVVGDEDADRLAVLKHRVGDPLVVYEVLDEHAGEVGRNIRSHSLQEDRHIRRVLRRKEAGNVHEADAGQNHLRIGFAVFVGRGQRLGRNGQLQGLGRRRILLRSGLDHRSGLVSRRGLAGGRGFIRALGAGFRGDGNGILRGFRRGSLLGLGLVLQDVAGVGVRMLLQTARKDACIAGVCVRMRIRLLLTADQRLRIAGVCVRVLLPGADQNLVRSLRRGRQGIDGPCSHEHGQAEENARPYCFFLAASYIISAAV